MNGAARRIAAFAIAVSVLPLAAAEGRITMLLDGTWDVEDSVAAEDIPSAWTHKAPVPGLTNLATPAFADVDQFDSRELINNKIRKKLMPESARTNTAGVSRQKRNYFWYRTRFRPPVKKAVAILRVNKAQFTTAVWVNGQHAGDHAGCFTAGIFNVTPFLKWNAENELIVRIGAHPGIVPPAVPAGTDFEKLKWTPGIYDSVSLELSDNPVIRSVQVAPRIAESAILVETELENLSSERVSFSLAHSVKTWKGNLPSGASKPRRLILAAHERRKVRETIQIADAKLWSPEFPFLYVLDSSTEGDTVSTRFGMREIRFDTATRRAWLNGKPYFLRGSNITLHRFFEDPQAGGLVWDERWVRKLLQDIPKRLHWNSFRFCIGPVPQRWLDIADEAGLLIQYEYFIWTGRGEWHREYGERELITEYTEFLHDNWNHPSVAIWDASNETVADVLSEKVIPAVRTLDLSNRAWDNGYNLPSGADDVIEDHPYLFSGLPRGAFKMADLERHPPRGLNAPHPSAHAAIANEYGWLWLNRDGSPTLLTEDVYRTLAPNASNAERLKLWAYLLGGLTEHWRASRYYAGVLHFVYLTCSYPGVFTSDHWRDLEKLELDPDFEDYVGNAFKPLGVYLNFWQQSIKPGPRTFQVSLINDGSETVNADLTLVVEAADGKLLTRTSRPVTVAAIGQQTYSIAVDMPDVDGEVLIRATACERGRNPADATVSRRRTLISR